ncbi:thiamine-phosphate kinase [candidate division KSB1 bacterium]|nr:thiamine-phosphate kinase [candidate division KSB1 bacterium]RQW01507.1 MAG: thiamine-phosphate kinase [candidate division KSB1 bacterium]
MKLSDIGEFGLIHRIAPQFLRNLPKDVLGIGDDCAVLPINENESLLITTDLLVEEVHFIRDKISARQLGHKSLAVNLSDIAAMGGSPTAAFLSIGLPEDIPVEWLDDFFAGLGELSHKTGTPLLGGDTTRSRRHLVINMAVLGRAHPGKIKYRSTAQVGDIICVTDFLGDSGGGLHILLQGMRSEENAHACQLVSAHCQPRPQLQEGAWLAKHDAVHAMLDVSDGIDSDIRRIMEESKVGARINVSDLPLSAALLELSEQFGWDATEIAASGGEDYCLLCTISPQEFAKIAQNFAGQFGRPLFRIGVIAQADALVYHQDDKIVHLAKHGWDHFV